MKAPIRTRSENLRQARTLIEQRPGITTRQLAAAMDVTPTAAQSLCSELASARRICSYSEIVSDRTSGFDSTRWRAVDPRRMATACVGRPFIPLCATRPTIVPVRAGGRLAPHVQTDVAVSFGRLAPADYYQREGASC